MKIPSDINLIDFTNEYLERNNINKTRFSELISTEETPVGRSNLSSYLNNSKVSNPEKIEAAIQGYFGRIGESTDAAETENSNSGSGQAVNAKTGSIPILLFSHDAMQEMAICQSCQDYSDIGIIIGKTGFGKTYVLTQYAKKEKVCYVSCDESMTSRDFIEAIEESIGLTENGGTNTKRIKRIANHFNTNEGYLLIIDEADKLMSKYSYKKMEMLRGLFDRLIKPVSNESSDPVDRFMSKNQKTAGLVIAGELSLEVMLKTYLPRFADRAGNLFHKMKGLSKKEVESYLSDINLSPEALAEMVKRGTGSNFRLLDTILKNLFRVVRPTDEIGIDDVNRACDMMMK